MKKNIGILPLENFQIHPEVLKTSREKDLSPMNHTMEILGQFSRVKTVKRSGQLYIIDGVSRKKSAEQVGLYELAYEIVDVPDDKIMEYRMLANSKTKKGVIETCIEAEYFLDFIGKSQGKKREAMGFDNILNDDEYGEIGKDRFELTCALLGIEMKSSTLRKLMYIYWEDYTQDGKSKTGILDALDKGRISIDRAYKLLGKKESKMREREKSANGKLYVVPSNLSEGEKPYQLYPKSCLVMDEVPDNSVELAVDSHPYAFGQREYRNQDEMGHGQESTLEEYLKNFKALNEEKYRKLKPGGVLVTIIGESYRNGYQGVCSRAELVLQEIGFKIIDVPIWAKSNQKYTPHPLRFQNSYERIIVAYKPGEEPYFTDVYRKGSVDTFRVKKTSSGGYYMASPETCIPNVIITPVYNPKELQSIDPDFTHDAPCPPEIYEIFIEAYSRPGDTILDGFVGSGTAGVALRMGRKVIGYDIDPLSIEFSRKRFDWFLEQAVETTLSVAA